MAIKRRTLTNSLPVNLHLVRKLPNCKCAIGETDFLIREYPDLSGFSRLYLVFSRLVKDFAVTTIILPAPRVFRVTIYIIEWPIGENNSGLVPLHIYYSCLMHHWVTNWGKQFRIGMVRAHHAWMNPPINNAWWRQNDLSLFFMCFWHLFCAHCCHWFSWLACFQTKTTMQLTAVIYLYRVYCYLKQFVYFSARSSSR